MIEVTEWFEPSSIPVQGVPVLAEYYPFNTRSNALAQHVVWFWEGEYRQYPQTTGTAYVERWAHLPSYQQAAKAERDRLQPKIEALEAALRDMVQAVCGETGFAAAVRNDAGLPYPWPALDIAEERAKQALESQP